MDLNIRQERQSDYASVYELVKLSFEQAEHTNGDEQNLVNRLRLSSAFIPELSLVAENHGTIVGYLLFTKMKIGKADSLALAPLAVLPKYQNQGIGGKLIQEGHRIARELGYRSVNLVGHPHYYPRFGYTPASQWGILAPFDVPDDSFLAIELQENGLKGVSGMIEYAKEFFE